MSWQEEVPKEITDVQKAAAWVGTLLNGKLLDMEVQEVPNHWPQPDVIALHRAWLRMQPVTGGEIWWAVDIEEYLPDNDDEAGAFFCRRIMTKASGPWGPPPPPRFYD